MPHDKLPLNVLAGDRNVSAAWQQYSNAGGNLNFIAWITQGMPGLSQQEHDRLDIVTGAVEGGALTPRARAILETPAGQAGVAVQQADVARRAAIAETGLPEAEAVRLGAVAPEVAAPPEAEPTEDAAIRSRLVSFIQGEILTDPQTGKFYDWRQFTALNELIEISPQEAENIQRDVAAQRGRFEPVTELTPFERASLEQRERESQRVGREAGLRAQLERERVLAGLQGPRDWIKFWFATHPAGPSPREKAFTQLRAVEQQIATTQEQLATDLGGGIRSLSELETAIGERLGPAGTEVSPRVVSDFQRLNQLRQSRASLTEMVETAPTAPAQPLPLVPEQIAQFIPGIAGGERLRAARIRTPSPQQLERAGPEAFQGLLGFADFAAGQNISRTGAQLIADIERMLPGRRGQLTRIRPARQRA